MELIGCYHIGEYMVEAYFPEPPDQGAFSIWVLREGHVIAEFAEPVNVESAYGMDAETMLRLEAAAEAAAMEVMRKDVRILAAA